MLKDHNNHSGESAAEDNQPLLNPELRDPESPKSEQNSFNSLDNSSQKIKRHEKTVKFWIFAIFVLSMANIFYDVLLFVSVIDSKSFENSKKICDRSMKVVVPIDMAIFLTFGLLMLYSLSFMREGDTQVGRSIEEFRTVLVGFYLAWLGEKILLILLFLKRDGCLFANLYDIGLNNFPKMNFSFLVAFYVVQGALLFGFFWVLYRVLADKRKRDQDFIRSEWRPR